MSDLILTTERQYPRISSSVVINQQTTPSPIPSIPTCTQPEQEPTSPKIQPLSTNRATTPTQPENTTSEQPSTSNTITNLTTSTTTKTMFDKLVELNHQKNHHTHHISILTKHLTNNTTPTNLTIRIQPWCKLSQQHQEAWDNGIRACMSNFTSILHEHHKQQLSEIEKQITSLSAALHRQLPQDISSTIINIATSHKPSPQLKRKHKHTTTKTSSHSAAKKPRQHTDFPKRPHATKPPPTHSLHQKTQKSHPPRPPKPQQTPISKPKTSPQYPAPQKTPTHHTNTTRFTPQPPPAIITPESIRQRLVGKQSEFPTIYNMLMKGKQ